MSPLLLALHLTCTNSIVQVRALTPGVGSWNVQVSRDLHQWRVVAAGHCAGGEHISVHLPMKECEFVRCEWR